MTKMYGARRSFDILRPKMTPKFPPQSAENCICMGKWAFDILAVYFINTKKAPGNLIILSPAGALLNYWAKKCFIDKIF